MLNDTLTRTLPVLARATSGAAAAAAGADAGADAAVGGAFAVVLAKVLVGEAGVLLVSASSTTWSPERGKEEVVAEPGDQSTLCTSHEGKRRRSPG